MTYREVALAIYGIENEKRRQYNLIKRAMNIVARTGYSPRETLRMIDKVFPDFDKPAGKVSDRAKEKMRKLNEEEALLNYKKKLDAGRSTS